MSSPHQPSDQQGVKPFHSKSAPWWQNHRDNLLTLLIALVLALGIRTGIAEARWIPSDSMLPTLSVGDKLIVEKVSYWIRSPERGEIIVFRPPAELYFRGAFIKRVIGLPGDRIRIENGTVYINQIPLRESYLAEKPDYTCPGECPGIETEDPEFVVPEHAYFVMGDNRNNSQDSHFWGFLPEDNIIGRAVIRFWPLNTMTYLKVPYYSLDPEYALIPEVILPTLR